MTDYPAEKMAIALEHIAEGLCKIAEAIIYHADKSNPSFFDEIVRKEEIIMENKND